MAEFSFDCVDVAPQRYAAGPTLLFRLRVAELSGIAIHAIALRCQIKIEPQRRRYDEEDAELLNNIFGDRSRWGQTLKPIHFSTVSTMVSSFTGSIDVELPVPCSYDLEVTLGQYFHALREGVVPMVLMFSGTVFGKGENGFWVEQVPWHHDASYRMPVSVWREMMDMHFPASAWLRLSRSTVDTLERYKAARAIPTWDAVLETLLADAGERVRG
ncbi:MAG: DUF6084 family protein [Sciscionella sp.]